MLQVNNKTLKVSKTSLECLGECLHTALRKCCDNDQTSLAYNAICLLEEDLWAEYCDGLEGLLYLAEFETKNQLYETVKEFTYLFFNKYCGSAVNILKISFRKFEDGDWENYCSYLTFGRRKG